MERRRGETKPARLSLAILPALIVLVPGCDCSCQRSSLPTVDASVWRDRAVATQTRPNQDDPRILRDLPYAKRSPRQTLDLYLPDGRANKPLVLFLHGGGWRIGDKAECPGPQIARFGFAVACANYRLSGEAPFPAQIHDVKAAARWLRANAARLGVDGQRIAAWGFSAGAHLAALLGTSAGVEELEGPDNSGSSRVQAVVDWFGPTDFRAVPLAQFPEYAEAVRQLIPGFDRPNLALNRLANPATHASPDDPPTLIMHGTLDRVVPLSQSELLRDALVKAGVKVEFHEEKNAGHGQGFHLRQYRKTVTFLRKFLGTVR